MPKNLEIKAKILSIADAEKIARSLQARFVCKMKQVDTYFNVSNGRLKLREIDDSQTELISYARDETESQRMSDFTVLKVGDGCVIKQMLTVSLGVKVQVEKVRTLFMFDLTRIHLDEVSGLGTFIEFEVLVHNSEEDAKQTMKHLIESFQIKEKDCFKGSYSDLLMNITG